MADTTIRIDADTSPAIAALDRLSKKIDSLHDNFKDKFGKLSEYTLALQASLVATGVAVAAFADEITDIADANQVAISQVLGLSKALEATGGKADTVGRLFQTMSNNIEEANSGNLKSLTTFNRLGVSLEDLGTLSNTALKDKLLDGLVRIKDPIEKNALAMQIFGKSIVGVNIDEFAAKQKQMAQDMEKYEPAIRTAGDAWDNMVAIFGKIKIAFAEAFEPIFYLISKLPFSIDAAVVGFRLLGIAVAALTATTILAGMAKLVELVRLLGVVASRNPLIAIASALLALGPTVASYLGLSQDITKEQEKSNDTVLKGRRNQTGTLDALKKEKDSLGQIRENLEKNFKIALDKYDLELKALSLTEDEKKISEAKAKVDEDAQNALFALKQKFDALDSSARARTLRAYEDEKKAIEINAEVQKKAIDEKLRKQEQYNNFLKTSQSVQQVLADGSLKMFEAQSKQLLDTSGFAERISLEEKINEIQKIRSALMNNISNVSADQRDAAILAISASTDQIELLNQGYQEIGQSITNNLIKQKQMTGLTNENAYALTKGLTKGFTEYGIAATFVADKNLEIAEQSRTFEAGWSKAFRQYVDNATNAAESASRIFNKVTQGMEDMLVGFFKTGKLGWRDFLNTIVDELLRSQIRQLIARTFGGIGGGAGGGRGGLLGGSIIPGFLAEGGPATAGSPYIVGERGPELFIPNTGGTVVPNGQLGGTSVTYNINAVDAMSFKQMIAADPTFLYAVSEQGRRRIPGAR